MKSKSSNKEESADDFDASNQQDSYLHFDKIKSLN
jgi:hypothetical protein